jgi:hypothetical protein
MPKQKLPLLTTGGFCFPPGPEQGFYYFLLRAPMKGSMKRNIKEATLGTASFRFLMNNKELFHKVSGNVSYEWVDYTP